MAVTYISGAKLYTMTEAADEINQQLCVKKLRWVDIGALSAADDSLVVTDVDDNVIWETEASGANYVESDLIEQDFHNGIKIDTIDGGTLYVYVR